MRKRILVLNLALIMILSLLPFGALAADLQLGVPATYTKTDDNEHEIMMFTPPETGIYKCGVTTPNPNRWYSLSTDFVTPECLHLYSKDSSGADSGVGSGFTFLLRKGETYQFYLKDVSMNGYRVYDNGDWTYTMQKADNIPSLKQDVDNDCVSGWYTFTPEADGAYQLKHSGSDRWSPVVLYQLDPYSTLDISVPVRLNAGETYYVSNTGSQTVTITEAKASGTFGAQNKLTWAVENDVLRIDGEGVSTVYEVWPWNAWRDEIRNVEIGAGASMMAFDQAFDFPNLDTITVDPENPNFKLADGVLYSADESELLWLPNDTAGAFTVPDRVQCVGALAFRNTKVTSVTLGENTQVRPDAFDGAEELKDVNYAGYTYGWDRMRVDAPAAVQIHCAKASDSITIEREVLGGSRMDVAMMLYRMRSILPLEEIEPASDPQIDDLKGYTDEQVAAAKWAVQNEIIEAYGNNFRPDNRTIRLDIAEILWKINGSPETDYLLLPYKNVWSSTPVSWAVKQPGLRFAIVDGCDFRPNYYVQQLIVEYIYDIVDGEKQLIDANITVDCAEHEWDEGVETAATCTGSSYMTYTCKLCGATRFAVTDKKPTGHNWGEWKTVTPATCTESGTEQRVCKNDSNHVEKRSIEPLGHDWTDWSTLTPATEETEGVAVRVCKHDNTHTEYKTIEKLKPGSDDTKPSPKPDDTKPSPKPDDTKPSPKPDDTKPTPKPALKNPFTDVKNGDYFFDPVLWALNHNPQITDGMTETTFAPGETCTRGQVVTFLWRAMGCAEPKSTNNPFSDVKDSDYFYKAVLWAVEKGITDGTSDTTFSPNDPCTRAHVVTFLWRAENKPAAGSKNPFTDVASGQYYYDAVLWAVEKGITDGTSDTTFSPADPCTRGQIVTFLYRDMK